MLGASASAPFRCLSMTTRCQTHPVTSGRKWERLGFRSRTSLTDGAPPSWRRLRRSKAVTIGSPTRSTENLAAIRKAEPVFSGAVRGQRTPMVPPIRSIAPSVEHLIETDEESSHLRRVNSLQWEREPVPCQAMWAGKSLSGGITARHYHSRLHR
jgi:hypothetical protein